MALTSVYTRIVFAIALSAMGCGGGAPEVQSAHSATFTPTGTMSVLGIYKDGRMSPESWNDLGSALLPRDGCAAEFDETFPKEHAPLAGAVDDYVRANGVTDALLAQLAPLAKGDTILVLVVAGHAPRRTGPTIVTPKVRPPGMRTMPASPYNYTRQTDGSRFDLSASLYSLREHKSIAQVSMSYGGQDVNAALKAFADRLGEELPMTCAPWNEATDAVDPEKIRSLKE
jgi:hypothetical protein